MRIITTVITIAASALLLTGCANAARSPAAALAGGETPVAVTETLAPTLEPVTATSPVGTTVPADQVQALRAAGAHIYVSPDRDETGIIVDVTPGAEMPAAVIADGKAIASTFTPGENIPMINGIYALKDAVEAADLSLFVLYRTGTAPDDPLDKVNYTVNTFNVPGAKAFWGSINGGEPGYPTKDGAIAEVAPITAANPTVPLIDLTN